MDFPVTKGKVFFLVLQSRSKGVLLQTECVAKFAFCNVKIKFRSCVFFKAAVMGDTLIRFPK